MGRFFPSLYSSPRPPTITITTSITPLLPPFSPLPSHSHSHSHQHVRAEYGLEQSVLLVYFLLVVTLPCRVDRVPGRGRGFVFDLNSLPAAGFR